MNIPPTPPSPPPAAVPAANLDPAELSRRFEEAREREEQLAAARQRETTPPPTRGTDADADRRVGAHVDTRA